MPVDFPRSRSIQWTPIFLVDAPDGGGSVAGSRVAFLAAGWTVEWFRSCGCEHGCRNSYGGVSHDCDRGGAVDARLCFCFAAAGSYLLTVLLGVTRLLWKWQRTVAMARRSMVLPLDASACRLFASPRKRQGRWCRACGGYCAVHQFQIGRSDRLRVLGFSVEGSQATFDWRRHIRLALDCVEKILIVGNRHWVELDRLQDRGQR